MYVVLFCISLQHSVLDWQRRLVLMMETVECWVHCQKNWLYLETIFAAVDIKRYVELLQLYLLFLPVYGKVEITRVTNNITSMHIVFSSFSDANMTLLYFSTLILQTTF